MKKYPTNKHLKTIISKTVWETYQIWLRHDKIVLNTDSSPWYNQPMRLAAATSGVQGFNNKESRVARDAIYTRIRSLHIQKTIEEKEREEGSLFFMCIVYKLLFY